MDEHDERRRFAGRGQEQIDELPRRVAVGKAELGLAVFERLDAVVLGRARPTGKNLRVIGHGETGAIFGL